MLIKNNVQNTLSTLNQDVAQHLCFMIVIFTDLVTKHCLIFILAKL